jgi:hypothetical protein
MCLAFAGIFTHALSGAVTLLIGTSGLIGGGARYAAVLARRAEHEIERATAFGFFLGFGFGAFIVLIDATT